MELTVLVYFHVPKTHLIRGASFWSALQQSLSPYLSVSLCFTLFYVPHSLFSFLSLSVCLSLNLSLLPFLSLSCCLSTLLFPRSVSHILTPSLWLPCSSLFLSLLHVLYLSVSHCLHPSLLYKCTLSRSPSYTLSDFFSL